MDADLYDEFGNYVGPELESDDDDDESDDQGEREEPGYRAGGDVSYADILMNYEISTNSCKNRHFLT